MLSSVTYYTEYVPKSDLYIDIFFLFILVQVISCKYLFPCISAKFYQKFLPILSYTCICSGDFSHLALLNEYTSKVSVTSFLTSSELLGFLIKQLCKWEL